MNTINIIALIVWSFVFIWGKRIQKNKYTTILSLIFLLDIIFNCLFNK